MDIKILAIYNIFSIIIFTYIYKTDKSIEKNLLICSLMAFIEVYIHFILCMYYIGWDSGFYLYPLAIIPSAYFISVQILEKDIIGHIGTSFILLSHQVSKILTSIYEPIYADKMSTIANNILYFANGIFAAVIFVLLIYSFLTDMRAIQKKLEKTVDTDMLTNLSTRRYINKKIKEEIEKFYEKNQQFAISIADIDDFKRVNDTYGHDAGDLILKEIAKILIKDAKELNINVCRWGGEEFLILMKNSDIQNAKKICERLLKRIREHEVIYNNKIIKVTITFGCAIFNNENNDIEKVLKDADLNLYKGKKATKNCVII